MPKPTSKTGKPRPQRWQLSGRHAFLIIRSNRLGEHVVVIDRRDLGLVGAYRWWLHRSNRLIYATAYINGQRVRMHKFLLPGAALVDHRDGNSLNNARRNLRRADCSINTFNSERPSGASGERGVDLDRGRFRARVTHQGRRRHLGRFDNAEAASAKYQAAARQLYGEPPVPGCPEKGEPGAVSAAPGSST